MKISGTIERKRAVIINAERLKSLCEIILKHCTELEFSARTYAGTKISFNSMDELLNYDNYKPRRIKSLELKGYTGYSFGISVEIGDLSICMIRNYGSTVRCYYQLSSTDSETIYKNDFEIWYKKAVAPYWALGKFSFGGLIFIPASFITFVRICGINVGTNNPNIVALIFAIILGCILVAVAKFCDIYLLKNLFPAVLFEWGEEDNRNQKWQKYRSNLLWGIIMVIVMGLITNYIYDTLKNINFNL